MNQPNGDAAHEDDPNEIEEQEPAKDGTDSWNGQDQITASVAGLDQADSFNAMGWQNGMNPMMQLQFQNAMQSGMFPNMMGGFLIIQAEAWPPANIVI